jgi:hypothetical protein
MIPSMTDDRHDTPTDSRPTTDTTPRLLIAVEPGLTTSNALALVSDGIARLQEKDTAFINAASESLKKLQHQADDRLAAMQKEKWIVKEHDDSKEETSDVSVQ